MQVGAPTAPPKVTPSAVVPGARTYDRDGFDAPALAKVTGWVDGMRDMFVHAGLTDAAHLPPIRIDFAPLSPVAEMHPDEARMLLGTYTRRNLPVTLGADLIRHEYTHYVLNKTLLPHMLATPDAPAMHESLADTFASVLDDDWTLGEDFFADGRVTRSMSNPADGIAPAEWGARKLPQTMGELRTGDEAHATTGIPNKAAFLIGDALGRERLASLYVDALAHHLDVGLGFQSFAAATLAAATDGHEREIVRAAWHQVGVLR
jgi:Zn-dependent metalloprotease